MLGTVGGTVILLVSDKRGEAAELDVAQPTEAGVAVLDRGGHRSFRASGRDWVRRHCCDGVLWKMSGRHLLSQNIKYR